jgi:hypothetical protein
MGFILNRLVADVTENITALGTSEHVAPAFLRVDLLALGAPGAVSNVDVGATCETQVCLNHFIGDLFGLNVGSLINALRFFFVVLLAFRW